MVSFQDYDHKEVAVTHEYIIDTGATHSSFPGYYREEKKMHKVWEKQSQSVEESDVSLISFSSTSFLAGAQTAASRKIPRDFTLRTDGTFGPLEVKLTSMNALAYKHDNVQPEEGHFLLSLDFLLQTCGCWTTLGPEGSVLNLEKLHSIPAPPSIVENVRSRTSGILDSFRTTISSMSSTISGKK